MESDISPLKKFAPTFLPWLLAVAAFVFYLATLNHWVSLASLPHVARASGWTLQPELYHPLYWLLTLPIRWLPTALIPLALNLFSCVCAVLTLALLARSVALLPHDRTEAQRSRERSPFALLSFLPWLPPVLAVLVCGLQLTFWEHATSGSSEMLDLLIFAYLLNSVLEFRIDERESRLFRTALVYGLAMSSNWALIAFLPVFLVALIWSKGLNFFNIRFLGRLSLWGLVGLSLYILLPLVSNNTDIGRVPFWRALQANLHMQKLYLGAMPFNKSALFSSEQPLWALALFSLLPLLIMSIRWPSYFGDPSKLGVFLATSIFHFFHAVLLVICVWLALDPQFSPRHNSLLQTYSVPGLIIYYLAALGVGYFSGYFLLVFGVKPFRQPRPAAGFTLLLNRCVRAVVWLLLVLAPITLLYRNLPQLPLTNKSLLKDYCALQAKGLPAQNGVLLSDDVTRLNLAHSAAVRNGTARQFVFVETQLLPAPDYHRFLRKKYPQRWPDNPPRVDNGRVMDVPLLNILWDLSKSNSLCYLHPSFGYYFELFYLEPNGLVYQLKPYPTNTVSDVPLSQEVITHNEAFWDEAMNEQIHPLLAALAPPQPGQTPGFLDRFIALAHLKNEPNKTASALGIFYSRALVFWGVQMQRNGHLPQAGSHFQLAQELNPDNVVAQANLDANQQLRGGKQTSIQISKSIEDKFGKFRNWVQVLGENGPFDEPTLCYAQGLVFAQGHLFRQAAREFGRVKTLAPDNLMARLFLAQIYLLSGLADKSLAEIAEVHSNAENLGLNRTNAVQLLSIETSANLALTNLAGADAVVQKALKQYPDDQPMLSAAAGAFMRYRQFTNALPLIDQQLKLVPDDVTALINRGFSYIQLKDYDKAIPPLTRALDLESTNVLARLDRAIAHLGAEKYDEAQADYEVLQKLAPGSFVVQYGLGEVAFQKKDTNAALRYFQLYLNDAPTNAPDLKAEVEKVRSRVKALEPNPP